MKTSNYGRYKDPHIICAAIKHIPTGQIFASARHLDPIMWKNIESHCNYTGQKMNDYLEECEDGFIDQSCIFYNRRDAAKIASKRLQTDGDVNILISEELY